MYWHSQYDKGPNRPLPLLLLAGARSSADAIRAAGYRGDGVASEPTATEHILRGHKAPTTARADIIKHAKGIVRIRRTGRDQRDDDILALRRCPREACVGIRCLVVGPPDRITGLSATISKRTIEPARGTD